MNNLIFIVIMLTIAAIDARWRIIPLWLSVPAILSGMILTGNVLPGLAMFFIGALIYSKQEICGGDVMLLAAIGSWLGISALLVFITTTAFIKIYRLISKNQRPIPYAPFAFIASLFFIL